MRIENLVKTLGEQYSCYGYNAYTMSKFEEYELYLRNKDFLLSDRVLTFTDTDGRLMALKPDVTLSIIKNTVDTQKSVQKLFYHENVYRPGKNDQGFREIMQVGLECMGAVDTYSILEVLLLACKSLATISDRYVLDVSHMGLICRMLDETKLSDLAKEKILAAMADKNAHEIREVCENEGVCSERLENLVRISGKASVVLPQLEPLCAGLSEFAQLSKLCEALEALGMDSVNIDFSVINDMNYYNGIVFRGFVAGVPERILSGGQYDNLMRKLNRIDKAVGFALYPALLEQPVVENIPEETELFYGEDADILAVAKQAEALVAQGIRVNVKLAAGN